MDIDSVPTTTAIDTSISSVVNGNSVSTVEVINKFIY